MTKTPATRGSSAVVEETNRGVSTGAFGDPEKLTGEKPDTNELVHAREHYSSATSCGEHVPPPQLVVTSPCRMELKADMSNVSGFSFGLPHPGEEESVCSDSGFGGSPASPLFQRKLSNASLSLLSPTSSFEEYEECAAGGNHINVTHVSPSGEEPPRSSAWKKPKSIGDLSSPLTVPPRKPQQWVQVVGHAGSFHAGDHGMLLKWFSEGEQQCLQRLMEDSLRPFVPAYHGVVQKADQDYNMMDDLLTHFNSPAIMDCKMGSRTYLEEELLKARERPQPRKDMFEKMVAVDPEAPTPQEVIQQAVLKTRYMQWRETLSSTTTLGFRIEGVKKADGVCNTNFKRTKSRVHVMEALDDFTDHNIHIVRGYLKRLNELRRVLETSSFFKTHEVVGSSLLFVHDHTGKVGVWMIDFGKTVPLPPPLTLDHRTPWVEGNREDGYLWGLDNLINILATILSTAQQHDDSIQKNSDPQHLM